MCCAGALPLLGRPTENAATKLVFPPWVQLNFVRTRLMGHLGGLDPAVPDIGKLARELQSWCDLEAARRGRRQP